ncbi:hypothetical protein FQB35_09720 [Crassaminicella thermophila]|uniref:Phage protein n=1 Tax=Crassaminicella thermophila TaxID=2599308 RepID=A0A5C0SE45_CRATE|nr:hypothetical protein [Crassaminicella thermophila]QEK12581.1 hypothetical protein FQB35_09720 [Crassaminicella thermophila]
MLTYMDIKKAINDKLKTQFTNIKIESNNIQEGIKRPSFFVQLDNIDTKNFMTVGRDRNLTVRIYYFPSDRYKNEIELLNIKDDLETLFLYDGVLDVNGYLADIDNIELDVVDNKGQDKVLHCYFDLKFYENWNKTDEHEEMEDLYYS